MCDLFGSGHIGQTAFRVRTNHFSFSCNKLRWRIVQRDTAIDFAVIEIQRTEPGVAKSRGVFQYCFEYRLQLAGR